MLLVVVAACEILFWVLDPYARGELSGFLGRLRSFDRGIAGPPVRRWTKAAETPKYDADKRRYEWNLFAKAALAIGIALAFLFVTILVVDDPARTAAFKPQIISLISPLFIWAAFPISYTFWSARSPEEKAAK